MLRQATVRQATVFVILVSAAVTCCNHKEAASEGRTATISLQSGKQVTGKVTASSAKQITVMGDDNITRTIPMDQVSSIAYSDQASNPPQGNAAQGYPPPPTGSSAPPTPSGQPGQPDQSAPPSSTLEVPAGTEISVRSNEIIDSARASDGQRYSAEITRDVNDSSGAVIIPRGSAAQLVIVSVSRGGRIRGASDLVLTLGSVSINGQPYEVNTGTLKQVGRAGMGKNKRTAEFAGGGSAFGAIIGAIGGGGKGAAIGAGAGGGAGALTQIFTRGSSIRVPAETLMTFRLDKPLQIVTAN